MRLYHGTNGKWLERILRTGLRPRGANGGRSNWNHTIRSNPRCVYLTDSYAPYFAFNASKGKEPLCAVLEIDTDRLDHGELFPDEDFLEQISRGQKDAIPGSMRQRTLHYRRHQFDYDFPCVPVHAGGPTTWWEASLLYLGTCSHRGTIPASAITRAVLWPHKPNLWFQFIMDPTISVRNQQFMGDRYRALTRKLFDGEFTDHEEIKAAQTAPWSEARLPVIEGWQRLKIISENNSGNPLIILKE